MKKILLFVGALGVLLIVIKRKDMTLRQSILKTVYPLVILKDKLFGSMNSTAANTNNVKPATSFYDLNAFSNSGEMITFDKFKGKKIMIVNTASDCGYTGQYEELEQMNQRFKDRLVVLGFPSNDFMQQEKGSDEEIASFCKVNYGVTFQLFRKSSVIKNNAQNEVFKWLSDASKNGWNNKAPEWNFSKYVVDEQGTLTHYFGPGVSPLSESVLNATGIE